MLPSQHPHKRWVTSTSLPDRSPATLAVFDSKLHSNGSSVFDFPTAPEARSRDILASGATPLAGQQVPSDERAPAYIVISGGTGCNGIVSAFGSNVTHVLPVSDNGGSSSEIIRVLGGPSIGDIRSRLIRLIPDAPLASPIEAIRRLLSHRFSLSLTEKQGREEWRDLVEGRSSLWTGIPPDRKETIRGFLVYFENELLRRAHKRFSFRNGSVGNYFLTAAHLFFRSVPSAIFLFSSITGSQAHILPVLVTNHTVTIAAELKNGRRIIGQCEISHPVERPAPASGSSIPQIIDEREQEITFDDDDEIEADEGTTREQNALFAKGSDSPAATASLDSPINRVYYINPYGQEVYPKPNPEFLTELRTREVLVYSVGSLWTSIVPCLALQGVASAIAKSPSLRVKVLLLNAHNDRETGGYTAVDYILAISETLNRHDRTAKSQAVNAAAVEYPVSAFVTHLVYLKGKTSIEIDELALTALGVKLVEATSLASDNPLYDAEDVRGALAKILETIE